MMKALRGLHSRFEQRAFGKMPWMRYRKVINEPIEIDENGVSVRGRTNAVIAANVNEPGDSRVSSRQKVRVVQRNGKTEVFEHSTETDEGGAT
jgi:hypothetical protein